MSLTICPGYSGIRWQKGQQDPGDWPTFSDSEGGLFRTLGTLIPVIPVIPVLENPGNSDSGERGCLAWTGLSGGNSGPHHLQPPQPPLPQPPKQHTGKSRNKGISPQHGPHDSASAAGFQARTNARQAEQTHTLPHFLWKGSARARGERQRFVAQVTAAFHRKSGQPEGGAQ